MSAPTSSSPIAGAGVRHAQVLVACTPLEPTLAFLQRELGFQVDAIFPADNPNVAMVSAHGVSLRLQQGASGGASDLYLLCDTPPGDGHRLLTAPNGLRIHLVDADPPMRQPVTRQQLVLT
ncbi:MAG: cupin, partial [Rhodoferax sp.]|nr:cupin [Rhodoferax sp.]